jgi:acetyl-CoA synthetase
MKQNYTDLYRESIEQPKEFWEKTALENIRFFKKWTNVFSFEDYSARWFDGGFLNVSDNCLDRHLENQNKDKMALIWEGEDGESKKFTYFQLQQWVCRCAIALEDLGVQTGDNVVIYLPLIPEAVVAMLACARIGAPHTVVFGGFSAEALADRINDCEAKYLITADGGYRKGAIIPMKQIADVACTHTPSVRKTLVVNRFKDKKSSVFMRKDRDVFWDEVISDESVKTVTHLAKPLPSEHPLFMLYTSGTTGKPKGLVHTTAGYLLGAHLSSKWIFGFESTDVLWTTADIGWITGHTYLVYGPLSNGATVFLYEGAPLHPHAGRFWEMIERYKISILYTAPTAIRTFVKFGREIPEKYNLSSLRLLGTVGEPISPQTWSWYHDVIGRQKCPVIDSWWQTETGSAMITPIPGHTPIKAGSASTPFFGVEPVILDEDGAEVSKDKSGFLCIKHPWPSMARTIYKDHARYKRTYWEKIPGVYFTGDGASCDEDGCFWITGRIDDVLNISGHRLSTVELENAILTNHDVSECAVVGIADEIKGQVPVAFVMVKSHVVPSDALKEKIQDSIEESIGHFVRSTKIYFVKNFPKTRSGKMLRRLLREYAQTGTISGDVTTLDELLQLV